MRNRTVINEKMTMLTMLMAIVMLFACCPALATETPGPEQTPLPEDWPWLQIETPYMMLQFPKENSELLVHEGIPFGDEYAEVFYIQMNDVMIPMFRIDFGHAGEGDRLGWLKTENGNVPVTLSVFQRVEEDFAALGEGSEENYGMLMMGLNDMLQAIFDDEQFTMEEGGGAGTAELLFGTVAMPPYVSWTETQENGQYQAIFYCEVQGENIALYTVRIGDEVIGAEIGYYLLDGVEKIVSVDSYSLKDRTDWADEDRELAYQTMESVNDVLQTLEASEYFSVVKQ